MTKLIVVSFLALCAMTTAAAQGAQGSKGCSILGTWATAPVPPPTNDGTVPPPWICTLGGESSSAGTIACDVPHWPNLNLAAFGLDVPAVQMTTVRGVWKRTGGSQFAFTQIGWAVDANGDFVYGVRNSGTETLSEGCNVQTVESTMEWLDASGNVVFAGQLPTMTGYRVSVSPPAAFP